MRYLAAIAGHPVRSRLLLAAFALLLWLPGLTSLPPVDRDEARYAQATRQMLESGNFVDIRFQDQPRYKKPAGIYWLQAASVRLAGGTAAEPAIWRYRLPSLLGAVASAVLTAWIGRLLFTAETGLLAGMMLAAAPLMGIEARLATTDAVLLALILAAMGALARAYVALARPDTEPRPGLGTAALFWLALAGGVLIKGPAILLMLGAAVSALLWIERRADWLKALHPLPGAILALAVTLPWFIAIMALSDGRFAEQSLGHDFLGKLLGAQEGHTGLPGYYAAGIFVGFWPFALPAGLAVFWFARQRREPGVRFCLAWLLPIWFALELIPTKLPHYALPLYPALALLTAHAVLNGGAALASLRAPWQRALGAVNLAAAIAIGLAVAGTGLWLPRMLGAAIDPWAWPFAVIAMVTAAFGSVAMAAGRPRAGIASLLATSLLASGFVFGHLLPELHALWPSQTVAGAVSAFAPCPAPVLASAGYEEPSLVFLLGTRTRLADAPGAAAWLVQNPSCAFALVAEEGRARFEEALATTGARADVVAQIDGFDYSNGAWQRLTLYEVAR